MGFAHNLRLPQLQLMRDVSRHDTIFLILRSWLFNNLGVFLTGGY